MKKNIFIAVIGAGAVATAVAVGRKIYELGHGTGKLCGYVQGVADSMEMSAEFLGKNIELTDEYNELSDKYDELVDDYNALREELDEPEFYGN